MAKSFSSENKLSKTDSFNDEDDEEQSPNNLIEMLIDDQAEASNLDVEYKLTENSAEKIPDLLLDKFNFQIDSELVPNETTNSNNNNTNNNNDDDFIDEDLFTDLESKKVAIKNEDKQDETEPTTVSENQKSILVSTTDETDKSPIKSKENKLNAENISCDASEPNPRLVKHKIGDTSGKIQFNTNEMIEFIIRKTKLKQENKHSTMSSDEQARKLRHQHKIELSKSKSLMTKSTHTLEANESAFIWTELEAFIKQHEQTGQSSCGASAIINVLKALNFEIDYDKVNSLVKINSRIPESMASSTTLAQYLFSRSVAGMNATEMIENIKHVTSNQISGRFFPFNFSSLNNKLVEWLAFWIRKGAVPVALLNLQKTPYRNTIPDAWHHQMIYAISSHEIYLTNPLERKPVDTMLRELNSESVLLVRTEDVLKRFKANPTNLNDLLCMREEHTLEERKRWCDLNVLGQVVNVLRCPSNLTHITIPASYVPGITLFARVNSNVYEEIMNWSDLSASNYL